MDVYHTTPSATSPAAVTNPTPPTPQLTTKAPSHTENDADACFGNKSWSRELFVAVVDEIMCAASG